MINQVNPINVGYILLENLKEEFGAVPDSPRSDEEDNLAKQLLYIIKNVVSDITANFVKIEYEYDAFREIQDHFHPIEDKQADTSQECNTVGDLAEGENSATENSENVDLVEEDNQLEPEDPDFDFEEEQSRKTPTLFSMDYMKKAVECYSKHGWKTTTSRFHKVKYRQQIAKFKKQLENSGSKYEKFRILKARLLKKYNEAVAVGQKIQDKDLQKWGHEICKELGFDRTLKVSPTWVTHFKQANNISFKDKKSDDETRIARKAVLKKYNEVKATGQKITEKDIQKWAQDFCEEMGFDKKIGIGWVYSFKKVNNIWLQGKKSDQSYNTFHETSEDGSTKRKKKKNNPKNYSTVDNTTSIQNSSTNLIVTNISSLATNLLEAQNKAKDPGTAQMPILDKSDGSFQIPILPNCTTFAQGQNGGPEVGEFADSSEFPIPPQTVSQDAWNQLLFPVDDPRIEYIMSKTQTQLGRSCDPTAMPPSEINQTMPLNFLASSQPAHNFHHGSS